MAFESVEQLVKDRLSAPGGMQRKRLHESALPLIVLAIGLSATFVLNHQATSRVERQASERRQRLGGMLNFYHRAAA